MIPSGFRIIKRPAINAISDTFEGQWNFFLCDAEEKLAQLLLKESGSIFNGIETQIETETSNDYEEKHLKFRQQLENRQAKKLKNFKEHLKKEKYDGVVQGRGITGGNEVRETLDGRSEPLKKTESDIVKLNVTNSVLTDSGIVLLKELIVPRKQ